MNGINIADLVLQTQQLKFNRFCSSGVIDFTPAANPTDIFSILPTGYDSVIKLKRVSIIGIADVAATLNVLLQSAPNGALTGNNCFVKIFDGQPASGSSVYVGPGAVCQYYTANDANGNRNGISSSRPIIGSGKLVFGTANTPCFPLVFEFGANGEKEPMLRDLVSWIVLNLQGQALPAGAKLSINLVWEEQRTVRVSFVGDSTYSNATFLYPVLTMSGKIQTIASIDNLGSNGYRLIDYINNTNGVTYPQVAVITRLKDIFILGYGINDVRAGATTKDQLIALLESAIATTIATNPDVKIILHAPNMITTDNFSGANYVTLTGIFEGLTLAQAAQMATDILYDAYEYFKGDSRIFAVVHRQDVTGRIAKTVTESKLMTDQLHPNERGQVLIARHLFPTLYEAVNAVLNTVYL